MDDAREVERRKYDHAYYAEHYWAEDLPGRTGNKGLSYDDPTHERRFAFLAGSLSRAFQFQSVLDAGCGTGLAMLSLAKLGKSVAGVDFSPAAKEIYEGGSHGVTPRPPFFIAPIRDLPFADRSFDLTWCSDVLEHILVFDAQASIAELIRVTKKVLVLTINLDNPYRFHPTILSRASWDALFLGTGQVLPLESERRRLQSAIHRRFKEYDVFAYARTP